MHLSIRNEAQLFAVILALVGGANVAVIFNELSNNHSPRGPAQTLPQCTPSQSDAGLPVIPSRGLDDVCNESSPATVKSHVGCTTLASSG